MNERKILRIAILYSFIVTALVFVLLFDRSSNRAEIDSIRAELQETTANYSRLEELYRQARIELEQSRSALDELARLSVSDEQLYSDIRELLGIRAQEE